MAHFVRNTEHLCSCLCSTPNNSLSIHSINYSPPFLKFKLQKRYREKPLLGLKKQTFGFFISIKWHTLGPLFHSPPNIHRHHVVVIVSATTLKSLTCEVNNNYDLNTVQLPAGKMWVLALTWTLLWHTFYCRPSNPLPSLPVFLPKWDNVSCQTTKIPFRNDSRNMKKLQPGLQAPLTTTKWTHGMQQYTGSTLADPLQMPSTR